MSKYIVLQVEEKDCLSEIRTNKMADLERIINDQASKGYRLHTFSTSSMRSVGLDGSNRTKAILVFEKI